MKERIQQFLDQQQLELPFVGTFHSFCLRLLKKNSELLENPFFLFWMKMINTKLCRALSRKCGTR